MHRHPFAYAHPLGVLLTLGFALFAVLPERPILVESGTTDGVRHDHLSRSALEESAAGHGLRRNCIGTPGPNAARMRRDHLANGMPSGFVRGAIDMAICAGGRFRHIQLSDVLNDVARMTGRVTAACSRRGHAHNLRRNRSFYSALADTALTASGTLKKAFRMAFLQEVQFTA
ncbi:hypothetical protein WM40_09495 [Robbsia andropogonis]|uniref:Uncharacterized protein n=1 Tax=Robbsia andropogonis TaxID=28092 RepID=A0A0F5K1R8_9BURK|nr:hypothetical protein WM40_09495 [Robbsia andropogonis]